MNTTRREFVKRAGLAAAMGAVAGCGSHRPIVCGLALPPDQGPGFTANHTFENWSRTVRFRPNRFFRPRTDEQLVALVQEAIAAGTKVRTQGAGHSFSQLLPTEDTLLTLDDLQGSITVEGQRATVPGGMRLKCAIEELRKHGLAFKNLGSITEQSVAGAFSTGTHGSGLRLGSISTQVVGMRMVTGTGDVHTITEQDSQELAAARINLGALGIITEVTLACVPDYELEYTAYLTTFDTMLGELDALNQENDRVVVWWLGALPLIGRETVMVLTKNSVGGPRGVLASASPGGSGVGKKRLANRQEDLQKIARETPSRGFNQVIHTVSNYDEALTIPLLPVFHRECEYAIPVDKTAEALKAFRDALDEGNLSLTLPVELRFVAQDDILLSQCRKGPVCYIGASTMGNSTEVFERFEPIMRSLGGKPHWGKNFTLTQQEVARVYPDTYETFREVRNKLDPNRVFTNTMLTELFP